MGIKYQTTKAACQKAINERGNVCDYCGRDIVPIKTVDNANNPTYWAGCMHGGEAGHFTAGTSREIFELAERLVCDGAHGGYLNKFDYGKTPEARLFWFQETVSSMCTRIADIEWMKTHPARKTKEEFMADESWRF